MGQGKAATGNSEKRKAKAISKPLTASRKP
jgi:hypothetical protein